LGFSWGGSISRIRNQNIPKSSRRIVEVKDGVAEIQLPDYYKFLNENTQIWVTAKNGFGMGYGIINEDMTNITILADKDLTYNILVIGTRKDEVAKKYWKGVEVEKNKAEKLNNN
jgi:hypothetical protein